MWSETNKIKEVAPNVYWVLLWCPESNILHDLLHPEKPYVLCWDYEIGNFSWQEFNLPITTPLKPLKVISRIVNFDFILSTEKFLAILPQLPPAIKAIQLDRLPPNYLDLRKIKGKQLYRVLGECGWHVLIDTPANDFGVVMSPQREVLERAIQIVERLETN